MLVSSSPPPLLRRFFSLLFRAFVTTVSSLSISCIVPSSFLSSHSLCTHELRFDGTLFASTCVFQIRIFRACFSPPRVCQPRQRGRRHGSFRLKNPIRWKFSEATKFNGASPIRVLVVRQLEDRRTSGMAEDTVYSVLFASGVYV